jgi:hypothetical protein
MGDLACRRPGSRFGGQRVVDPDGRTVAEVPSTPQNAAVAAKTRTASFVVSVVPVKWASCWVELQRQGGPSLGLTSSLDVDNL